MLKLTKKADYGLIALKHLAVNGPESSSAKEIADTYGIPMALLSKILQKLVKEGFLASEHGTNGGYKLAREAREITALEVIRAIDGPIFLTACFTEHGYCCHTDKCIVRDPLQKVHEGILRLLASISIGDMALDSSGAPDAAKSAERLYGLAVTPPVV
ncbi:MAG TPA: Rrf2 family transcriptional regulator [Bryobacteraceae bacterium]|nr:Rrf2 family transcriptional regulator [Bryobacteraceae bacterium]